MPTEIHLQNPIAYGILPLVILFIILVSPAFIKQWKQKRAEAGQKGERGQTPKVKKVPLSAKQRYVNRIQRIESDYANGARTERECYIILSSEIREFVKEYAGIDVTSKTLAEIRGMKLKKLEALIEEYYVCEFSTESNGNVSDSVKRAIKVIEKWN